LGLSTNRKNPPSERLRGVPPPVDSEYHWCRLMNHLFGCGEDELFVWLRDVRAEVCGKKKRGRAA